MLFSHSKGINFISKLIKYVENYPIFVMRLLNFLKFYVTLTEHCRMQDFHKLKIDNFLRGKYRVDKD